MKDCLLSCNSGNLDIQVDVITSETNKALGTAKILKAFCQTSSKAVHILCVTKGEYRILLTVFGALYTPRLIFAPFDSSSRSRFSCRYDYPINLFSTPSSHCYWRPYLNNWFCYFGSRFLQMISDSYFTPSYLCHLRTTRCGSCGPGWKKSTCLLHTLLSRAGLFDCGKHDESALVRGAYQIPSRRVGEGSSILHGWWLLPLLDSGIKCYIARMLSLGPKV